MLKYLLYFLAGGSVVAVSTLLAEIGQPFLAGILMVLPSISLVGFFFINKVAGSSSVLITVKSSLLGTVLVWPVYMVALLVCIPRFGVNRSLGIGFLIALVLAVIFVLVCRYTPVAAFFSQ